MTTCLIRCDFNIVFSFFFYILWIRKHDPKETCKFVFLILKDILGLSSFTCSRLFLVYLRWNYLVKYLLKLVSMESAFFNTCFCIYNVISKFFSKSKNLN